MQSPYTHSALRLLETGFAERHIRYNWVQSGAILFNQEQVNGGNIGSDRAGQTIAQIRPGYLRIQEQRSRAHLLPQHLVGHGVPQHGYTVTAAPNPHSKAVAPPFVVFLLHPPSSMPSLTRQCTLDSVLSWWSDSNSLLLTGPTINLHAASKPLMRFLYHWAVLDFIKKNQRIPLTEETMQIYESYLAFQYVMQRTKTMILREFGPERPSRKKTHAL
ncbi:hypothetical protein C8R44DRAFT_754529 [Mycena epipterygia]|nr:hypothetical protein C8R44DRAFT_754529 [Mycena epipterygia]